VSSLILTNVRHARHKGTILNAFYGLQMAFFRLFRQGLRALYLCFDQALSVSWSRGYQGGMIHAGAREVNIISWN
jgi:hypothetical protein